MPRRLTEQQRRSQWIQWIQRFGIIRDAPIPLNTGEVKRYKTEERKSAIKFFLDCKKKKQAKVRWMMVKDLVKARPITLYWQEQTAIRIYSETGHGRKRDREEFEQVFCNDEII